MYTILLVLLILMLLGALPAWPYSRSWGYYPSGGLGLVVGVVLVFLPAGRCSRHVRSGVLLITARCDQNKWWDRSLSRHLLFGVGFTFLRSSHVEPSEFCLPWRVRI